MLINCNFITIVLYNLFQTISKDLANLINDTTIANFSNIKEIKQEYKVEYFLSIESSLFVGRVISNVLFIFMAFTNSNFIMAIFVIFAAVWFISSIRLQTSMNKFNESSKRSKEVIING